ncbi:MAG: 3-phosphoshikimate 1-carboxyvinyltransferase [Bacteroidia bacterium]
MKSMAVVISIPAGPLMGTVQLPASKSLSNRLLTIRSLSAVKWPIDHLSEADDTRVLNELLEHPAHMEDAGAGGTTFRFLLAVRALQQHRGVITGSPALLERPVHLLVEALREMGAAIDYLGKEGFPPLQLNGGELIGGRYSMDAGVSSQFLSALMMIGPCLPGGLILETAGTRVSSAYVEMTASVMRNCGVQVETGEHVIVIPESAYQPVHVTVSADWSAAVFIYAWAALRPGSEIFLPLLKVRDAQGDARTAGWMEEWGVETMQEENGLRIVSSGIPQREFEYDFLNTPDLAQAFAVMAALSGRTLEITGLSTLRNKETDRLKALYQELSAVGVQVEITNERIRVSGVADPVKIRNRVFPSYQDHRMVMALSLLASSGEEVVLDDSGQVSKSFPGYFREIERLGAKIVQR